MRIRSYEQAVHGVDPGGLGLLGNVTPAEDAPPPSSQLDEAGAFFEGSVDTTVSGGRARNLAVDIHLDACERSAVSTTRIAPSLFSLLPDRGGKGITAPEGQPKGCVTSKGRGEHRTPKEGRDEC